MKKTLLIILSVMLFVSCGEEHKAEGVVKQFLKENLVNQDYKARFNKLGHTQKIDAQQLSSMQKATQQDDALFKKPVKYGAYKELQQLLFIRTTIIQEKDTFIRTIYLHPELPDDGVVAIKEN
ncbi:MAG: hypothetical protein IKX65_10955 [Prevotella sp.]|nr:hypothetical protein [Prevotella sp.]